MVSIYPHFLDPVLSHCYPSKLFRVLYCGKISPYDVTAIDVFSAGFYKKMLLKSQSLTSQMTMSDFGSL